MTTDPSRLTGGCLCGAVRYAVSVAPDDAVICHCRMCQRASGGPAQAYARVPRAALANLAEAPTSFRSSPDHERRFCPHCGAPVEYRSAAEPDRVWISLGTLDDPSAVRPTRREHVESAAIWRPLGDGLPAFAGDAPAGEAAPPAPVRALAAGVRRAARPPPRRSPPRGCRTSRRSAPR